MYDSQPGDMLPFEGINWTKISPVRWWRNTSPVGITGWGNMTCQNTGFPNDVMFMCTSAPGNAYQIETQLNIPIGSSCKFRGQVVNGISQLSFDNYSPTSDDLVCSY